MAILHSYCASQNNDLEGGNRQPVIEKSLIISEGKK